MIQLKSISAGTIEIELRSPDGVFLAVIDDFDDDLRKIPKFTASLMAGDYPSGYLSDYSNCLWSYTDCHSADFGILSLRRELDPLGRATLSSISIKISRPDLVDALHALAKDIATHENFARGYLFFAGSTDPRMDLFFEIVDREWNEGVKAGLFPDDFERKMAYEDRRFIEEFPLATYEAAVLKENQEMLLSVAGPDI